MSPLLELNLGRKRRLPVFLQTEAAECGLACIGMIAVYHGHKLDLNALRLRYPISLQGATLQSLMTIADRLSLAARPVRLELAHLGLLQLPAVLHWDLNHFVVLKRLRRNSIDIHDPAVGVRRCGMSEVSRRFTGVALELTPTQDFKPIEARVRMRLSDLWSRIYGLRRSLIEVFALSLLLQIVTLLTPLYLQIGLDSAAVSGDLNFLVLLAVGFGAVMILGAVTELLRGWIVLYLGNMVTFQMFGNVFRHLIRLPASFFDRRHIGDILSRMNSTEPIQTALTTGLVTALIDGIMVLVTGIVMWFYAPNLAAIVVATVVLHVAITIMLVSRMRVREEEELEIRAKERTHLIESIRAAIIVKLFGKEVEREALWRNIFAEVVNADTSVGKYRLAVEFSRNLLFGLQLIVIVYLGLIATTTNRDFTLGMLFAFIFYRQSFTERITSLTNQAIQFQLLKLHLERLADIVKSQAEEETSAQRRAPRRPVTGLIELDNVWYRYSSSDPFVIRGITLRVEPGEFVALIGPSGSGKTTLMKLILGLYEPTRGEIRVEGIRLQDFGLREWRAHVGVTMQDDQLLSGTIAENICFFDPVIDMERVEHAARRARVHDDIIGQPMGYLGLVGDMGTTLSGGQKQRVLLARALYRDPRILVLDEGTANLDEATERQIADVIASMPVTRIVIAHRPELVRRADRVIEIEAGRAIMRQFGPKGMAPGIAK